MCFRELEGLIFECGLHLEELKEQVEEMQQEQPTREALPSLTSPPHTLSSVPSEREETPPQVPPFTLSVNCTLNVGIQQVTESWHLFRFTMTTS